MLMRTSRDRSNHSDCCFTVGYRIVVYDRNMKFTLRIGADLLVIPNHRNFQATRTDTKYTPYSSRVSSRGCSETYVDPAGQVPRYNSLEQLASMSWADSNLADDEGWTLVTRKCKLDRVSNRVPHPISYADIDGGSIRPSSCKRKNRKYVASDSAALIDRARRRISTAFDRLSTCRWWASVSATLASRLHALCSKEDTPVRQREFSPRLVCLGLGSFVNSANACNQFAAAMRMYQDFCTVRNDKPLLADPAMTVDDEEIVTSLGFEVVKTLDSALCARQTTCFRLSEDGPVAVSGEGSADAVGGSLLLFMPHCERHLYDDVLQKLWGPSLLRTVLFSNSFRGFYGAGTGSKHEWTELDLIVAQNFAVEERCPDSSKSISYEAFNDLAIINFNSDNLCLEQNRHWTRGKF